MPKGFDVFDPRVVFDYRGYELGEMLRETHHDLKPSEELQVGSDLVDPLDGVGTDGQ